MVVMVVIMILSYADPCVPIHRLGNRFSHRHMPNIRVPSVPATRIIHMGGNGGNILDNTGLFPCLELEIVRLGMSLVTHLGDNAVFLGPTHHDLYLLECAGHRFLYIYMFAVRHRLDRDREVGMIRHAYAYGIDLVRHPVEHRAEVLKTGRFREHVDNLLRVRGSHVHVAESYYVTQTCVIQFLGDLAPSLSDADERYIYPVIGAD